VSNNYIRQPFIEKYVAMDRSHHIDTAKNNRAESRRMRYEVS